MSYDDKVHYEAEPFKKCLDALLKPIIDSNHGRNAPVIQANDIRTCCIRREHAPVTFVMGKLEEISLPQHPLSHYTF
jgi:hypothetical protein